MKFSKNSNKYFIGLIILIGLGLVIGLFFYLYFKSSKKDTVQLEFVPPGSGYISRYDTDDDPTTEIITNGTIPAEDIEIREISYKDAKDRYVLWDGKESKIANIPASYGNSGEDEGAFQLDIYIKTIHCTDFSNIMCDRSVVDGEFTRIKSHSLGWKDFETIFSNKKNTHTGRFNLKPDSDSQVYINLVFIVTHNMELGVNSQSEEKEMKRPVRTGQDDGIMEMASPATEESYRLREYFTVEDFESTVESDTLTNEDVYLEQVFIVPDGEPDTRIFFYQKDGSSGIPAIVENVSYKWNDKDLFGIDISVEESKCADNNNLTCSSEYKVEKDGKTYQGITQNQEVSLQELGDPIAIDYDGTEVYKFSLFLDTEKQHKFNMKFKYNMSDKVQLLSNLVPENTGSKIVNISYISPESVTTPLFDGTTTSNVEVTENYIDGNVNIEFEEGDDVTLSFKNMTKTVEGLDKHYEITDNNIKYKFVIKKDDPPTESSETP